MRDIEFRGKRTDNGEWVYGYYAHLHKTTYCFKEDCDAHPENELHRMIFEREQDWGLPNYHLQVDVDPKTVGQYIGLKDKNGTKIFEGDIVDVLYDVNYIGVATERIGVFEVVHNGCFMGQKGGVRYHFIPSDECTVIGNIYDNPELLGGNG